MAKWADYVVVGVRYNDDHTRIIALKRHPDLGDKLGKESRVGKTEVMADMGAGYTHVTAYWNATKKVWTRGERVGIVRMDGIDFIRTDSNHTKEDNLGELPEFSD